MTRIRFDRVVLASANPDKATEIAEILAVVLGDQVSIEPRPPELGEIAETGTTLIANARLKAMAVCSVTGLPAVADDTGLEVDALGGAPGVYAARFAGEGASYRDNVDKLLAALEGEQDRRATFRTVALIAFPDGSELVGEGAVQGTIATVPQGSGGFGYDAVFIPDGGGGQSYAELSNAEKNAISHRGRALRALAGEVERFSSMSPSQRSSSR